MEYNITYRQKDGGWQYIISFKENEKWKQKSKQGFRTRALAKKAADIRLDEIKEEFELKNSLNIEYQGITFGGFGKMYLEHVKLYKEPKTNESTVTVLNRYSALNNLNIDKISFIDIQKIVDEQTQEGLNPNTIKYYLKKLTAIFNSAKKEYKIITEIPTRNIKVGKSPDSNKKALNEIQVKKLLNQLEGNEFYLLVFLAVNTGMRLGEILGLTWDCIDFKHNTISVNEQWKKNKDGEYDFGELKTKNSKRIIPISNSTKEVLKKCKQVNVRNIDNRVVPFDNKDSVSITLNKFLKDNGYDITMHELRHTYATKLIANGLDFKTVASILGHDVKQTIATYSHVNNDMINRAKKVIENIF